MINGDRYRVVTKEEKSTLYIKSVTFDDFGFYVCKAINDAGEVLTRTKLMESVKAYMIEEDIEEAKQKVEKKLSKRIKVHRKASLVEETNSSSVNFEATVKSRKSKSSKKSAKENVSTSATIKKARSSISEEKNLKEENSQLTISRNHVVSGSSTDSDDLEEINDIIQVTSKSDLDEILKTDDFKEKIKLIDFSRFNDFSQYVKEFALILYMIEKRVNLTDIMTMFNSDFFPKLKTPVLQSALVKLVEKTGNGNIVSEILSTKSEIEIENQLASIGMEAFLKMTLIKNTDMNTLINSMDVNDFRN